MSTECALWTIFGFMCFLGILLSLWQYYVTRKIYKLLQSFCNYSRELLEESENKYRDYLCAAEHSAEPWNDAEVIKKKEEWLHAKATFEELYSNPEFCYLIRLVSEYLAK